MLGESGHGLPDLRHRGHLLPPPGGDPDTVLAHLPGGATSHPAQARTRHPSGDPAPSGVIIMSREHHRHVVLQWLWETGEKKAHLDFFTFTVHSE